MVTVGIHEGVGEMSSTSSGFAPTLLLIHGFLDDASVWDGMVESLGDEIASLRYDLPGFGTRTEEVGAATVATLESLAAEAGRIVGDIDGPVIVVGQSLGTQVAELVATRHPEQVRGLVLLTPVPLGGTRLPEEAIASFRTLGGDPTAQRALRAQLSPYMGEAHLDRLTDVGVPVAAETVSHYVDVWNDGLATAPTNSAYDAPVLIVRGGADAFVTEDLISTVSRRFDHAEVKVIDTGGHWVHVEHPGAVAAMVLDFADSLAGVTP